MLKIIIDKYIKTNILITCAHESYCGLQSQLHLDKLEKSDRNITFKSNCKMSLTITLASNYEQPIFSELALKPLYSMKWFIVKMEVKGKG